MFLKLLKLKTALKLSRYFVFLCVMCVCVVEQERKKGKTNS